MFFSGTELPTAQALAEVPRYRFRHGSAGHVQVTLPGGRHVAIPLTVVITDRSPKRRAS